MQKAEGFALVGGQLVPIAASGLQQAESADDVGFNERACACDRAIDMAFCGEMEDGVWLEFSQRCCDDLIVTDIYLAKQEFRRRFHVPQRRAISRVGQLVDHEDVVSFSNRKPCQCRADKAGAPCDDHSHSAPTFRLPQLRHVSRTIRVPIMFTDRVIAVIGAIG